jgi:hypothetical protein
MKYERSLGNVWSSTCGQGLDQQVVLNLNHIWTKLDGHGEKVGCHLNNHPKRSKGDGTHNEFPYKLQYLVTSLGFFNSFNPKKLIWEVIVTRLSNEELMKNERTKALETTSIEATLLSKKLHMQRSRNKSEDIYNYCKQ